MNPEMLETLLLDRALGELPPEVSALLDAHLARDPTAADRAAALADTLRLARTATAVPSARPHRPLDVERLRRIQRAQQTTARRWEMLRLAACLALGLNLGWLAHAPQSQPQTTMAATPPPAVSAPAPAPAADRSAHFWSLARFVADQSPTAATVTRRDSHYELRWNSAAKMPRVEEKL